MFKSIIVLLALVAAVAVASSGVPTVTNCSPGNVIFTNLNYTWWPNNVQPGAKLYIKFSGDLTQTASALPIHLVAALDGLPIINKVINICPFLQGGLTCPVAPGPITHQMDWYIPQLPLPGSIVFTVTLRDQTAAELVCINIALNI